MPLPPQIQEALGELVGAAREGLLALSVGVGLGVVHELMELEVDEVVGPKGKHNAGRVAVRHGHDDGSMTLGGRRVPVRRPRMRSADDERELPVESYEFFADRDPLTRAVMDRMLAGVSTRRFAGVGEPVGSAVEASSSSTSKTSVSELFIERTRTALGDLMSRGLDDVRLAVMMLDGLEIAERTHVVALGITTEGVKIPLGLWEGSDGERDVGPRAAGRSRRPRPGPRAGDPVRDRRRQGAAARDQGRLRRARAGAPLPSPQGAQRLRSAARARPRPGPRPDARARGRCPTPSSPASGSSCSPPSSTGPGPTPPGRSGKACTTR